jgi:hypothetical protein
MHPSRAIRLTKLREITNMVFDGTKPSTTAQAGQRGGNPTSHRIFTHCLGLIALCVMLCGCNSIYHQALATAPAEAEARLALRLEEARAVDRSARDAARQLLALLHRGGTGDLIRAGFDRLQKEALGLNRKVLAVRDETGAGVGPRENQEIEVLNNQAKTWLEFAAENRSVDTHIAARRLEVLLGQSVGR